MQRNGQFHEKALPLANQLCQKLEEEHVREVVRMYEEQWALRQELERVVNLMVTEMIPREKAVHDAMEKINDVYAQATQHLHHHVSSMSQHAAGVSSQHDTKRKELFDPLQDTEKELARIQNLLAQPVQVPPDLPPEVAQKLGNGLSPPPRRMGGGGYGSPPPSGSYSRSPTNGRSF